MLCARRNFVKGKVVTHTQCNCVLCASRSLAEGKVGSRTQPNLLAVCKSSFAAGKLVTLHPAKFIARSKVRVLCSSSSSAEGKTVARTKHVPVLCTSQRFAACKSSSAKCRFMTFHPGELQNSLCCIEVWLAMCKSTTLHSANLLC